MIINPEQAAIVKRIFADILSGKSTNAIADELNAEKIPSKKNNHWTASTIRGILANEKYTGDVFFKRPIQMKTLTATQIMVKLISIWPQIIMNQLSVIRTLMQQMRWLISELQKRYRKRK